MQKENVNMLFPVPLAGKVARRAVRGANKAFTLIELLVVVLIIGILAAVAVPQYKLAVAKSKFVSLQTSGEALAKSAKIYFLTNGKWPTKLTELDILPAVESFHEQNTRIKSGEISCFFNGIESLHCYYGNAVTINDNVLKASSLPTWSFYFSTQKKYCNARTDFHKKVCQTVGGVLIEGTNSYLLGE